MKYLTLMAISASALFFQNSAEACPSITSIRDADNYLEGFVEHPYALELKVFPGDKTDDRYPLPIGKPFDTNECKGQIEINQSEEGKNCVYDIVCLGKKKIWTLGRFTLIPTLEGRSKPLPHRMP